MLSSIDARLDAVEGAPRLSLDPSIDSYSIIELVQNEDIYSALKDGLRALNKVDMDKVIVGV